MLGSVSLTRVSFGVRVRDRFYVLQLLLGCVSLTRVSFGVRVRDRFYNCLGVFH